MRDTFKEWLTLFGGLLWIVAASCSGDNEEGYFPSLVSDFACIETAAQGTLKTLRLDDGTAYGIGNAQDFKQLIWVADTTYRVVCRYLPVVAEAELYAVSQVISHYPLKLSQTDMLINHPVALQSIWKSGEYINIILDIQGAGEKHTLGFIETSSPDAAHIEIALYHCNNGDSIGYTHKAYCSLPLTPYRERMEQGDTLTFSLLTYRGWEKYPFTLQTE